MSISIMKSNGKVNIESTSWCFFGPPKIGKTTLASGYPDNLFIVHDPAEVKRLNVSYVNPRNWEELNSVVDDLVYRKSKYKYKILTFDFIDVFYTFCESFICGKYQITHVSDAGYGKGYDSSQGEFKRFVSKLFGSGYGLIFISHLQIREINTRTGTITKAICTLPDRARKVILPMVSEIGYIGFVSKKIKSSDGKVKFVERRVLSFESSEYLEAGDRDGVLPNEVPLSDDPKKTYEYMKDYYEGRRRK